MNKSQTDLDRESLLQADLPLLKAAVESAQDSVIITDKSGAIRYANPAFESTSGYALADVIGKTPRFLKSGLHDASFYEQMWKTILAGNAWKGVITNKTRDGRILHEEETITPVRSPSGEITHFVAIKRDVTEKEELKQRLVMAEKMSAAGVLATGIAHEVNNPLTLVIGFAQLLHDDARLPEDVRDMMAKVLFHARRAGRIAETLLEFGSKREPVKKQVLIRDIFERMEPLAGYQLKSEGVAYRFDSPADDCVINADITQIEQVLLNLIINANQAMRGREKKELVVSCRRDAQTVSISVKDSGPGIPEDQIKKIFEPFYTTKPAGQGTGLGLSICYGIAEEHGGCIGVKSEVGEGTEFTVSFPAMAGA